MSQKHANAPRGESFEPPEWLTHEAAALMRDGTLPTQIPATIFAEPGRRQDCALCGNSVEFGELAYRADVRIDESKHFHALCFKAWQSASRGLQDAPGWSAGTTVEVD